MKLLLFHPQLLHRTCDRCRTWLYDDKHQVMTRAGCPVRRPSGSPTPCWQCPKQSPEQARGYEYDMRRIARRIELYFQVRATSGRCLDERAARDALVARHLALVDTLVRAWELARGLPR
ncbi:MAG TPA: hypothetical protein VHV08_17385 [Pirellulales bacterium]|nr:hypothetical protein [Pirellulales bacterium]